MIGHIQSRKTRQLVPGFSMIHSVDRLKIARRLNDHSEQFGSKIPVLLECNVSGELTKEGWDLVDQDTWPGILPEFNQVASFPFIDVRGLMTMAPFEAKDDELRRIFGKLRELLEYLGDHIPGMGRELSMGMTDDFEIAIEEGATMVRIGRAIFGPRNMN
jgi:pyridoxal phosphate enzyme (YggS family)